jgi:nucleoside-diphosphate-sugar epimerase
VPFDNAPADRPLPRHVLVTGADGQIGTALVDQLVSLGVEVTALGLNFERPSGASRMFTADAADEAAVSSALTGVDAVVHLAAIAHPSLAPAREVFVRNTSATFTVLDRAGAAGIRRAVVSGSINAFGIPMNHHDVQPAYFPLDENSPVDHDDAYSLSKWTDEYTARWAASRWGMDVLTLRFPLVKDRETILRGNEEILSDNAELARLAREGWAYLVLDDAVTALIRGLVAPLSGARTVLIAADTTRLPFPTEELLDRFAPGVERRRQFPGRAGLIDTRAARELLDWAPQCTLDEAANNASAVAS